MNIVNKKLSRKEFDEYVKSYNFSRGINKLVIHHTWRPTVEGWNGERTLLGIKRYYEDTRGWNAGPHIFVAPDGIWLFTDMNSVGIHAGEGNAASIGIEVVGDYDAKVWSGEVKENAFSVISSLMRELSLGEDGLMFHRDFTSTKSCPGNAITKDWVKKQLESHKETSEIPDWTNVAMGLSSVQIWEIAMEKGYVNKSSKPNSPMTPLQQMIYLARVFPEKFESGV